jgi:hypothetical protein
LDCEDLAYRRAHGDAPLRGWLVGEVRIGVAGWGLVSQRLQLVAGFQVVGIEEEGGFPSSLGGGGLALGEAQVTEGVVGVDLLAGG